MSAVAQQRRTERSHLRGGGGRHAEPRRARAPISAAGWWRMVRLQWRTVWAMLLGIPLGFAVLISATAAGMAELYPGEAERAQYIATLGASPASIAFNGRGYNLDTLGGITAFEVGFMGQLAIPVFGILLAIQLTRSLEDSGALELVTSARVSRTAVPLAAATSSLVSWVILVAAGAAGMAVQDYPVEGSVKYAAVLALFGVAFTGVGLLVAQLSGTARGAGGIGIGLALGLFLVRAVIDGLDLDLVWATPHGWVAELKPYGETEWWPAAALGVLAVATTVAAVVVCAGRDLGSGVLPQRLGRDEAPGWLVSPLGLAWRLTRGGVIGWGLAASLWAIAVGAMSEEFVIAVEANPSLSVVFGTSAEHLATVLAVLFSAVLATALGLTVVLRYGTEEVDARLGLLHAGRLPRWRWWVTWAGYALAAAVVVLFVSVALLGIVQRAVMDRPEALGDALGAARDLLAPVAAMIAVGALLTAAVPRLRGVAWVMPAWALVVGVLGEAVRMPDWLRDTSPLEMVGKVPVEEADETALLWLGVTAVVALLASLVAAVRRDLARG